MNITAPRNTTYIHYKALIEKKVSWIPNCRSTQSNPFEFINALRRIKRGASKELIERIRRTECKTKRNRFKQQLPAVCFSGILRNRTELISGTGIACLDFDNVSNPSILINELKTSEFILAAWRSPSGYGVKALVRIPVVNDKHHYKEYYNGILKHFNPLDPDPATSDISRLCFESYDSDLYFNKEAGVFTEKIETTVSRPKKEIKGSRSYSEGAIVDRLLRWWTRNFDYSPGNRNNNLYILACSLSNYGVSKTTTEDLFISFEDRDFNHIEIQKIIDSAYKRAQFNIKSFA